MSNLMLRVLTSILLLPIVIYTFMTGGVFLLVLLGLVSLFCSLEIANIVMPAKKFYLMMACIFWAGFFGSFFFAQDIFYALAFLSISLLISNLIILFKSSIDSIVVEKLATIFYFIFYVMVGIACLYWLSHTHTSLIFLAFAATWGNDTCAYFGGRAFGKHALYKSVSAKKTWEGFFAGAFGSMAIIAAIYYLIPLNSWHPFAGLAILDLIWVVLGAVILAPLGDLIESRLKRIYHTKDASNILPGHGGLLDRIDGLLLVIPWTAIYAFFIHPL